MCLRKIMALLYSYKVRYIKYHPKSYWKKELGGPEKWADHAQYSLAVQRTKNNMQEIIIPLMEQLHSGGGQILDAGCGAGFCIFAFAESGLWDFCFGVDFQEHRINFAKRNYSHPKIAYLEGVLQELPFPDNFFDTIYTGSVLTHIPIKDKIKVANEFKRCLKPTGFYLGHEGILPGEGVNYKSRSHMITVTLDWLKHYFSPLTVDLISSEKIIEKYNSPLIVARKK